MKDDRIKAKVLVVEDEESIRRFITLNLSAAGYLVEHTASGEEALKMLKTFGPKVVVLDLMLPGISGLEVCQKIRETMHETFIIMLTAKGQDTDKILGLELGADDYMTKPFSPRELVARVKAVLRRSHKESIHDGELAVGKLRLNFASYAAYLDNEKLELTPKEYELLKLFITNVGKAYTREQLLEKVWGYEYFGDTRTVDVHVRHLRAKLANQPEVAEAIETVRGVGYRFSEI